jgi:hypothetical protein
LSSATVTAMLGLHLQDYIATSLSVLEVLVSVYHSNIVGCQSIAMHAVVEVLSTHMMMSWSSHVFSCNRTSVAVFTFVIHTQTDKRTY